jgi:hypothetical protein
MIDVGNRSARTDLLVALKDVQPPPNKGLASLGRLVVLEQGARPVRMLDRVRRSREQARRRKVRLCLVLGRCGRGARPRTGMRTGSTRACRATPRRAPPALVGIALPAVAFAFALTVDIILWTVASIATFAVAVVPLPPRSITVLRTFVGPARVSTAVSISVSIAVPSPSPIVISIRAVFSPPRSVVFVVGPHSSIIVVLASSRIPFRDASSISVSDLVPVPVPVVDVGA